MNSLVSRYCTSALALSLSVVGVAFFLSTTAEGAGAKGICMPLDVYPGAKPETFRVGTAPCTEGSDLFGTTRASFDAKIEINSVEVKPELCSPEQKEIARKSDALGDNAADQDFKNTRCFQIKIPSDAATVNVKVSSTDGTKEWQDDGIKPPAPGWKLKRSVLIPTESTKVDSNKTESTEVDKNNGSKTTPASPCESLTGREKAWCSAYVDGLKLADLWDNKKNVPTDGLTAPEVWVMAKTHVSERGPDKAVLFFEDATPVAPLPQLDEDDKIITVVMPKEGHTIGELRVTTCKAANLTRIGGGEPGSVQTAATEERRLGGVEVAIAEKCSADGGMVAVLQLKDETTTKDIKVPTLALNRFTIGLGLLFDFGTQVDYRAASVKGENTPIIVKDEHLLGISTPVPFISLRPVPVDLKRNRRFSEMWALSLGVSLVAPLENIYGGILFEPLPGFGVIGGVHAQKVPSLAGGYKVGDRFPGGDVPVDKRWKTEGINGFLGLNLDASLLSRFLEAIQ